ncbi:hypothetical protein V7101_20705, partial [Bacillus velezensis]|uniref:hypothetical protein n=1 Tax=Bacillus velezensis TaxID=492670 RepID=UPI002FFEA4E2
REVTYGVRRAAFAALSIASDGTLTFAAPKSFTGVTAVNVENSQEQTRQFADDQVHIILNAEETKAGTITTYQFAQAFLENHLGKKVSAAGGLTDTGLFKNFALQWIETVVDEIGGQTEELHVLYNVKAAAPTATATTKADSVEGKLFEVPITVLRNNNVLDEDGVPVSEYILRKTDANAEFFEEAFERIILPGDTPD